MVFCLSYAKTAKKVDMKKLKVVAWSILNQASTEVVRNVATLPFNFETVSLELWSKCFLCLQEKENRSASPEKQLDKEEREGAGDGTQFSSLYKTLKHPSKIGRTMSENLSVPLAFIGKHHHNSTVFES